jgi:hypothetical protein
MLDAELSSSLGDNLAGQVGEGSVLRPDTVPAFQYPHGKPHKMLIRDFCGFLSFRFHRFSPWLTSALYVFALIAY